METKQTPAEALAAAKQANGFDEAGQPVAQPTVATTTPKLITDMFESTVGKFVPLHPKTFAPLDTWIEFAGTQSDEFTLAVFEIVEKSKAYTETELSNKEQVVKSLGDERELAGKCIVGWDEKGFGPFSEKAAVELMTNPKNKWLYVQVKRFLDNQENFLKG